MIRRRLWEPFRPSVHPHGLDLLLSRRGTFVVVVLHGDDAASRGLGVVDDGLGVQGLDGERVDHTDVDPLWGRSTE